ncbi:MAG: sensor histidine kinase [Acetatifactor sp.]|nr:sensor histidine kinase [Acetatifactor sp.]
MIHLSLKHKLILYTYIFIIPIVGSISAGLFINDYNQAKVEATEQCLKEISILSDSVVGIRDNLVTYGTYITINEEIKSILSASDVDTLNNTAQLWYTHAPMKVLEDMIALETTIKTVALYPENRVTPYLRCFDESSYLAAEKIWFTREYIRSLSSKGAYNFTRVEPFGNDFYDSVRSPKLVLYREIYNMSRTRPLGYLCIGASTEELDNLCKNLVSTESEAVCVYGISGGEFLSVQGNKESLNLILDNNSLTLEDMKDVNEFDNCLLFTHKNDDFVVAKVVNKNEFYKSLINVLWAPLTLLLGILLGMLPVLMIITNNIFKPLTILTKGMDEFKEGNLDLKIPVTSKDEIGKVSETFNDMVSGMKELINKNYILTLKEKESEIATLSAQINPHFLYNTLDSLYWRVIDTGNDEIAEDILALSDLFRLVLGGGERYTTVETECEMLKRYLQIQQMRFGLNLHYDFKIDENVLKESIPKLILQPFVENAVVHGFEKGQEDFTLTVTASIAVSKLFFEIKDNGAGMSDEELGNLFKEDSRQYRAERVGHFAIKNIKERLEILYKDDYSLNIESTKDKGTTVMLFIPLKGSIYENTDR